MLRNNERFQHRMLLYLLKNENTIAVDLSVMVNWYHVLIKHRLPKLLDGVLVARTLQHILEHLRKVQPSKNSHVICLREQFLSPSGRQRWV